MRLEAYTDDIDFVLLSQDYCCKQLYQENKFLVKTKDWLCSYADNISYEIGTVVELQNTKYLVLGYNLCYVFLLDMSNNTIWFCPFIEILGKKVDSIDKEDVRCQVLKFALVDDLYKSLLHIFDKDENKEQLKSLHVSRRDFFRTKKITKLEGVCSFMCLAGLCLVVVYVLISMLPVQFDKAIPEKGFDYVITDTFLRSLLKSFLFIFLPSVVPSVVLKIIYYKLGFGRD